MDGFTTSLEARGVSQIVKCSLESTGLDVLVQFRGSPPQCLFGNVKPLLPAVILWRQRLDRIASPWGLLGLEGGGDGGHGSPHWVWLSCALGTHQLCMPDVSMADEIADTAEQIWDTIGPIVKQLGFSGVLGLITAAALKVCKWLLSETRNCTDSCHNQESRALHSKDFLPDQIVSGISLSWRPKLPHPIGGWQWHWPTVEYNCFPSTAFPFLGLPAALHALCLMPKSRKSFKLELLDTSRVRAFVICHLTECARVPRWIPPSQ